MKPMTVSGPMPPAPQDADAGSKRASFPTTHWTLVFESDASETSASQAALEALCRSYWYPIYSYVRRQGKSHHEAEDLTQGFIAHLLATGGMGKARPERGRFRTFLVSSLRNFLTNKWHRDHAAKRGGGQIHFPLDFQGADERFVRETPDEKLTPEQEFDRSWALGIIERALTDLEAEYAATGRRDIFDALGRQVWSGNESAPPATIAARLGIGAGAVRIASHRLRRRLRTRLERAVAETVAQAEDVSAELHHLLAAAGGHVPRR